MTKEKMKKLKKGDIVYVACKVDAVFIEGGFIQVSTRDCDGGFDAYEDEVLEQEEDCISRADAIKTAFPYVDGDLIADDIKRLPPIIPQPKTGEWILNEQLDNNYQCSECGMFVGLNKEDVEEGWKLPHYCSNCGTKMAESEVEE